jgi:hypothetical protein
MQDSFIAHADLPNKEALRKSIASILSSKTPSQARAVWAHLGFAASSLPLPFLDDLERLLYPFQFVHLGNSSPQVEPLPEDLINLIGALSTFTVLGFSFPTKDFNPAPGLSGVALRLCDADFWEFQDPDIRLSVASQVALCLAIVSLESPSEGNMPPLTHRISTTFGFDPLPSDPESAIIGNEWSITLAGGQVLGLLTVACFTHLLRSSDDIQMRADLPQPRALTFSNVVGRGGRLPLPDEDTGVGALRGSGPGAALRAFGAAPSWSPWVRNIMDVMIEDLSKGEWVGYYSYGTEMCQRFDAPLRRIYFTTWQDPHDRDMVLLRAEDCVDGVGQFQLEGMLSRTAGWVNLEKVYDTGVRWHNAGWLTPLGIVGYWGAQPGWGRGFVWMFKREWARAGAWTDEALAV